MNKTRQMKIPNLKIWEFPVDGFREFLVDHPVTQKYSDRINNKIRSEYGVVEEIVSHSLYIGNYYERILHANLVEYLPSKWKIGTGFIFDDSNGLVSPQVDLIIYDDRDLAPVFKTGDLIVVRPSQVQGIIEVKKKLRLGDIDDLIDKYLFSNTGSEFQRRDGIQVLNIFSYEKTTTIEKYCERVVKALKRNVESLSTKTGKPKKVSHVTNLTIPRFFFLDDNNIINVRIQETGLVHKAEVSIEGILYSSGGASDLFSRFIWHSNPDDFHKIRFSTAQLYGPVQSFKIDSPIILRRFVTAREACKNFCKADIERLNKQLLKDLIGFYLPYGLEIKDANDLKDKLSKGVAAPITEKEKSAPKT